VVNGILLLIAAIVIIPIIAVFGLQWYFRKNQIAGNCPMCGYGFVAMKNTNVTCGQCGENLSIGNELFDRYTPEGTIEVDAVSVGDNDGDGATAIEVEVVKLEPGQTDD
jgi:ribosomal protein S27AE